MTFGGCYLRSDSSIENMSLQSVQIEGIQQGLLTNFEITQIFMHSKQESQEISYIFPNDMKICIYDLTFYVGDEKIKPKIKPKDEAKKIYDEAISKGKTAVYSSNVRFGLSEIKIGNLQPKVECKVILKVALLCKMTKQNSFFLKFPIDVYTPSGSKKCLDVKSSEFNFKLKCDSEKVENVTSNVKNFNFDHKTKMFSICKKIENRVDENSIIIFFDTKDKLANSAIIDSMNNYENILITVLPEVQSTDAKNSEFIFFVDCSGSMSGSSIKKASECLEVFIRSLPFQSHYNIIRFGSSHEKLFQESVEYNEKTMQKGLQLISNLKADLGGTELYQPLNELFEIEGKFGQRQIFIITDGEVDDSENLLEIISNHSKNNRCFSIGVGRGCDAGLVEGIAKASNGKCDFVQEGDSIVEKVIPQLECSFLPFFESIEVHIEGNESFEISPFPIPPISANDSGIIFVHSAKKSNLSNGILVTASYANNPVEIIIDEIVESQKFNEDKFGCSSAIFPLFVFTLIQQKQLNEYIKYAEKAKIIDLSISSGVLSKFTSYVGVLEQDDDEEEELFGGFDDLFGGDGGFYISKKSPNYAKIIGSDSDDHCKEEEEVELAGGFDDFFGDEDYSYNKNEEIKSTYNVIDLIKLQKFEGCWEDLDIINKMINMNVSNIDGISLENKDLEKKCISTVLAIAIFHVKSQNEKNIWSLIEKKAISWLKSNLSCIDIAKIIENTENSLRK